jgi:hypothetical protein
MLTVHQQSIDLIETISSVLEDECFIGGKTFNFLMYLRYIVSILELILPKEK